MSSRPVLLVHVPGRHLRRGGFVRVNTRPISPVDILSHDVYERAVPHTAFARLRREMPVAWHDEPGDNAGFWAVTRWADLVAVHRDHQTFSSQVGGTELEELERDPEAREARRTMLETDPPEHTRLRRMVSRNFTRRSMDRWSDTARALMAETFEEALAGGVGRGAGGVEVEFVGAVARELPILLISRILGVPDRDTGSLFDWADKIIYHADPDYADVVFDREDTDPYRLLAVPQPGLGQGVRLRPPTRRQQAPSPRRRRGVTAGGCRRTVVAELQHAVPVARHRRQRDHAPRTQPRRPGARRATRRSRPPAGRTRPAQFRNRGDPALRLAADPLPAYSDDRHRDSRGSGGGRRQGRDLVPVGQLRRGSVQ